MTALAIDLSRDLPAAPPSPRPTIWGLDPVSLHDRYWAAHGVCVVRLGERTEIHADAELYLLTDARTLALFRLAPLIETLSWVNPGVMFLRLLSRGDKGYKEQVVTDDSGRFVQFRRLYGGASPRLARLALTRSVRTAEAWQVSTDARSAWRQLRREARSARRETATISGRAYNRTADREVVSFMNDLVRIWKYPLATVRGIREINPGVWGSSMLKAPPGVRFIGSVWVGAGRDLSAVSTVLGPAVLWDAEDSPELAPKVVWSELEPAPKIAQAVSAQKRIVKSTLIGKRVFDMLFALIVLLLTSPLYPLVILAIWIEDGRPFFFGHRRQTLGGREFSCFKFRSMRKDADVVKAKLALANQADGPQFFIKEDPRLTRVGRIIRKLNIDELPQFFNVLVGDMSVVGPRPSPASENQFNPAWRDARLSVRAGVTGLWQVRRTRLPGRDFQEWIKFDTEYVRHMSWRQDLGIIFRTLRVLLRG